MGTQLSHPGNRTMCVFCKRWNGNADLVFKNPRSGFQFTTGVYGKCMANGSTQPSTGGVNCRSYEPSYEASKLL